MIWFDLHDIQVMIKIIRLEVIFALDVIYMHILFSRSYAAHLNAHPSYKGPLK